MKVYSWSNLLTTIMISIGVLTISISGIMRGDGWKSKYILLMILAADLLFTGVKESLTKEGYEKAIQTKREQTQIFRNIFGAFAPVMRYLSYILMVLAVFVGLFFPKEQMIVLCLFILALFYQPLFVWFIRREITKDKSSSPPDKS